MIEIIFKDIELPHFVGQRKVYSNSDYYYVSI